jgi:hypothetical protein
LPTEQSPNIHFYLGLLKRSYALCPLCQTGLFPLDEELRLLPGHLTPSLQESLAHLNTWMPFPRAVKELKYCFFGHLWGSKVLEQELHPGLRQGRLLFPHGFGVQLRSTRANECNSSANIPLFPEDPNFQVCETWKFFTACRVQSVF